MSQAGDIITAVKALIATDLGATYRELPRAYDIESIDANRLDKGYTCRFDGDAVEDLEKTVGQLMLTRTLSVFVTYRTFSTAADDKTKTVEQTVHTNEESLALLLRRAIIGGTTGRIREMESAGISKFITADSDSFLLNELKFKVFYRVS